MIKTILFVCTGNTCRSAMAEGILKKMLEGRTKGDNQFNIVSAGIYALPGMNSTYEAILAASELGVDISQHKAHQLREDLVKKADLILVMSHTHKDYILKKFPFAQNKVFLLKKYARGSDFKNIQIKDEDCEIVDPLGKPIDFYRAVATELGTELGKIIHEIDKKM
jgi:protein-tyrosine-phosphatase